ncbi:helix-turn-helix transcriptional regulator [Natronomonas halophila]|uniref:helix-turn-helix transcriptional regulator n=1 Tax=Natronomonas halophila TaxID=2747817 RepID=UPI0015B5C3FC|nr:helix-turn-helix transcriptional regulator [Natronomonas halophila]QLD86591.1 helix-turn-helix transcriptional regulator [Natronomonas halophila]
MTDRREEFDAHPEAEKLDAADAFSLLGDSLRLDIIRVLWEAGRGNAVPFSDLYDRVDVSDTGKFNYHRQQLVPHYVRKSEDGYRLTQAGERVARAVNAGIYTENTEMEDFDVRGSCYDCGAADLRGEYVGGRFRIDCRDCDNRVLNVGVPPSAARGRDPAEFVDTYEVWARTRTEQAKRGVCPVCTGPMEPGLSEPIRDTLDIDLQAVFDCTVCDRRTVSYFGMLALWHEDVEAFLRERDPSLLERPYWAVEQAMTDRHATLVSEEPFRYRVTFRADGDVCAVAFDDTLDVVELSVEAAADE